MQLINSVARLENKLQAEKKVCNFQREKCINNKIVDSLYRWGIDLCLMLYFECILNDGDEKSKKMRKEDNVREKEC